MRSSLTLPLPGTLGIDKGGATNGVLVGKLTATTLSKFLTMRHALDPLCITDDGGVYVNETTDIQSAATDDVLLVGSTIAVGDAIYFGHGTLTFDEVLLVIGVQGAYTTTTFTHTYWNGTAWTALAGVVDGTTDFTAAVGEVSFAFTKPTDWVRNTVDSVLGYWIKLECDATTGSTTQCELTQGWVVVSDADATWVDDTTDANDVGTADVALMPGDHPVVSDACFIGHATEKFCMVSITISTVRTGTATLTWKYWDGTAWTALGTFFDASTGLTASTAAHILRFVPPDDWAKNTAANGPDGNGGYFIKGEYTAITTVTADPIGSILTVFPITTGATGVRVSSTSTYTKADMYAFTASAANADSEFVLINATRGRTEPLTWTKAVAHDQVNIDFRCNRLDQILLVQIKEDATTEFAAASLVLAS